MKKNQIQRISVTALFCALAFLMTFIFRFKVSFLTFDFKDAIISVVSLLYGPVYGVISALLVAVLEFLSVSDTGVYGLIMNFISSGIFALACGTVYKFKRDFTGAIISVVASVICVTVVMLLANILITPYYMGLPRQAVIEYIPSLLLPFNLCKALVNASALLIIYKPVTNSLKKSRLVNIESSYKISKKTVILTTVSLIAIILAVLYLIYGLGGSFQIFRK